VLAVRTGLRVRHVQPHLERECSMRSPGVKALSTAHVCSLARSHVIKSLCMLPACAHQERHFLTEMLEGQQRSSVEQQSEQCEGEDNARVDACPRARARRAALLLVLPGRRVVVHVQRVVVALTALFRTKPPPFRLCTAQAILEGAGEQLPSGHSARMAHGSVAAQ
jgi:hypothetical protein